MNFSFRKSVKVDFNQAFAQKINPRLKEVSYDTIREIQETFQIFDVDKKNSMKLDDLKIALMSLGLKTSNDEFQRFVKQFKLNNPEKDFINYQEFYDIACMRLSDHDSVKENKKMYQLLINHKDKQIANELLDSARSDKSLILEKNDYYKYNISSCKYISEELLMSLAKRFHENMSDQEIKELLNSCDFNEDGNIDESDFLKTMKRTKFQ